MSFSAEMKDFLNAYKTGQGINASRTDQDYKEAQTDAAKQKTLRDNDPDTLALATAQAKATLANTQDHLKTSAVSRAAAQQRIAMGREQLNQLRATGGQGSGLLVPGAIQPGGTVQPVPQGALPIPQSTVDTGEDMYAEGGLVDDEEEPAPAEPEGVLDTAPQAAPVNPAANPGGMTDVSARRRDPNPVPKGLQGVISPALVEDARRSGMIFGIEKAGLHQTGAIRTPAQMLKAKQIAQGVGGLNEQEMAAAKKAVDPEGKLSESQQNVAALGSVYQFWANKGEPEKAQRVAFQMLQYYRNASQRYAAIAAKAAEGGNMDLATKAALKAYANVPDGKDLEIVPNPDGGLMYTYTDANGDVINKGVATPQQLVSSAMGLASGGFDKALLSAAGATQDPNAGAVKAPKPASPGDRAKEAESIGGEIDKQKAAWQEKNKDTPVDETLWQDVGNTAQHVYQQNPNLTANEAARAARAMLDVGEDANPEKPGFKVKPGEEGKPSTVDLGKIKIKLDDDQLENILNTRAARVKTVLDAKDKEMADSDKSAERNKKVGEAARGILDTTGLSKDAGTVINDMADKGAARGALPVDDYGRPL